MTESEFLRTKRKGARAVDDMPIVPIVEHYGGEVREGRNVSVRCFLHADKRRSAVLDTIKQVYYCHTCAQGGNAISLVMMKEGVDKKDAFNIATGIIERAGFGVLRGAKRGGSRLSRRTWDI